ncbi:portal protein [Vibrio phage 2.117.O._10N.261.45.E9]|nr:portal protein [Vibrio phage 1.117.O._10N.261.45.E9]AUR95429.1 portal protein [Vibrio phage 1.207.B._10N.222.51.C2]AUS02320.1 portal protein [Vibrio phage 2.117.O._10N.261.45.E9]
MGSINVHPQYTAMLPLWKKGSDCFEGEDAIKAAGTDYLKPTEGMILDGYGSSDTESLGNKNYDAYKSRAIFPDIYADAVEASIGILHRNDPVIELPEKMKDLMDEITLQGESIPMLLRAINAAQLTTGRIGILGDLMVKEGKARPHIVRYAGDTIVNWNDTSIDFDANDTKLVVLDESRYVQQDDMSWEYQTMYRILALTVDGRLADQGQYSSILLQEQETYDLAALTYEKTPNMMGTTLKEIPFSFINSKDIATAPDQPPLNGLANLCLAIYRGEADYRQTLFMQGQETLVRIGANGGKDDESVRTGTGSRMDIPQGGDAKYIGISSSGLAEQRQALANDYSRAMNKSGQVTDASSRSAESGDALKIRMAAQAATLPVIAKAGANGLQKVLRSIAVWMGANPEEVVVTPNLEFTEEDLNGQTLLQMVDAKAKGAVLSSQSIHQYMQENGMTGMTFEEEKKLVDQETEENLAKFNAGFNDLDENGDPKDPEEETPDEDKGKKDEEEEEQE